MGERFPYKEEAGGSSPSTPTLLMAGDDFAQTTHLLPPSPG